MIIAFMEKDKFESQRHDNSVCDWLPVSSAVCRLGNERYPDKYSRNFDYSKNLFNEGYHETQTY